MFPFFLFQVIFASILTTLRVHKVNTHCSQVKTVVPTECNTLHLLRKSPFSVPYFCKSPFWVMEALDCPDKQAQAF